MKQSYRSWEALYTLMLCDNASFMAQLQSTLQIDTIDFIVNHDVVALYNRKNAFKAQFTY